MLHVKSNRNKLELRKTSGLLERVISERAQSGDISPCQTMVLVLTTSGQVDLRNLQGTLIRTISTGATGCRFSGTDVVIQKRGKTELRTITGLLIRQL